MDRNSIIGFVLLLLLAGGYFFWSNHEQQAYYEQKRTDSLAKVANQKPIAATPAAALDTTTINATDSNAAPTVFNGKASRVALSNELIAIDFTTKGAYPVSATLDSFKTYKSKYITKDKNLLKIFDSDSNRFAFTIPINGKMMRTDELYFTPQPLTSLPEGGQQLRFIAQVSAAQSVELSYTLPKDSYMITASMRLVGFRNELSTSPTIPLSWTTKALATEKDLKTERLNAQIHFNYADGEHDYFTLERTNEKDLEKPVQWMSMRTHFFNSTIIADKPFKTGKFTSAIPTDSAIVMSNTNTLQITAEPSDDYVFGFRWFMGPNDYSLLKSYKLGMEEMIPLGFGVFFFVKYISKWMIIPLFNFLSQFITSFGVIIIVITLIIRTLLSFFSYKSYLSSAKMRVLKPELDELRAKFGEDKQQMSMEQMKLYRTAGVNPLGGCLPMLLQMPFLLAMYYFFPTAIQLRQSRFLWAEDLSAYDSILNFGFNIPMYGDHISLFTLLMTITSLLLALYNKNMTGATPGGNDPSMAMMKWMPFVMPIMFLGWFNSMAAGLTFYYTFSNILSLVQQWVIQKFFINEKAIHAQLQENKVKPKTTSKWQQKMEEMQKMQAERLKQNKK